MNRLADDRGFVLVLVLVTVAALSAGAIAIILQTRASGGASTLHVKSVDARALIDAASARAFHAIPSSDDLLPVWQASRHLPLRWEFNGAVA